MQEGADHIGKWVPLTEAKLQDALSQSGERLGGGISHAVRELGIDRAGVQRAAKIASSRPRIAD